AIRPPVVPLTPVAQGGPAVTQSSAGTAAPRVAAIVGPYTAGKTSLLETLLFIAGAIPRKGSVAAGNTVGDAAPEARARQMTIEPNIAHCSFLGDPWVFVD